MELVELVKEKKKVILLVLFFFILGLFISIFFTLLKNKKSPLSKGSGKIQTDRSSPSSILNQPKLSTSQNWPQGKQTPPPTHIFETYENKANLPTIPKTVKEYTFKTDFSLEEVKKIASKLGLTELKQSANQTVIFYNLNDPNHRGLLTFELNSGEFTFESYGNHKSPLTNAPANMMALSFLQFLGVVDETVSCPITYQKRGLEGVTFVECHRDWKKAGLPILNFVGLLNIPENKPLSQLTVGTTDGSTPADPSIINVSNGENGKTRPNDFNTITVAVSNEGKILFIKSNLRQIKSTKIINKQQLLSPYQALKQFMDHKATLQISSPRGSGIVNLDKVYPQNQARAKKAIITDYVLTFLEKPPGTKQEKLSPMYLIRGTAQLDSGYTVKFLEALPASKTTSSVLGSQTTGQVVPLPTYPAGANNPLGATNSSLSWYCLKSQPYKGGSIQPDGKTDYLVKVTGEGFPAGAKVYIVGCVTNQPPSKCTTGNSQLDNSLNLHKDPDHQFIVEGENPVTLAPNQTTLEKVVYSYSTDPVAIHSFYGVVLESNENQEKASTIQYGTLKFKQNLSECTAIRWTEPSPTPILTNPLPPTESCPRCKPSVADLDPVYEVEGVNFGKWRSQWYYILPANATEETLISDVEKIRQNFESITGETTLFRELKWIVEEFGYKKSRRGCPACPVRITGQSPSIFIYGKEGTLLTILPKMTLTYSDPSVSRSKSWSLVIKTNNILQVNDLNREYIYYEYQPVKFDRPKNGWVIEKSQLEKFANYIAQQLKLNDKESKRLITELKLAAFDVSGDRLFIGLIPQKEVSRKLPLIITPQPELIYRYHFYLTSADENEKVNPPKLSPIKRNQFMVLEIGANAW